MNTYISKTITFSHDEIGTIAVRKIQRCMELGEKRKRAASLRELSPLIPSVNNAPPEYSYKLLSISLGVDVNGEQLVIATFRMAHEAPKNIIPVLGSNDDYRVTQSTPRC